MTAQASPHSASQPEQLRLGGMPPRLFACTPSRLAAFDCPRRYRLAYLQRPAPPRGQPWAHNMVGATAHVALARWWHLPHAQRTAHTGADLVRQNWQNIGFRDDAQSARARETTAGWVGRYLEDNAAAVLEPLGVERTVGTRTDRLAITGRVDRIDDRDGHAVVVDYKTGRREPTENEARSSQALALYALAVQRTLRRPCTRVELHHLPTGTICSVEHTDASLERHVSRAEQTAADIRLATDTLAAGADPDDVFPPVVSNACGWCDFRTVCPEGRAGSAALQPWSGLADPDVHQAAVPSPSP